MFGKGIVDPAALVDLPNAVQHVVALVERIAGDVETIRKDGQHVRQRVDAMQRHLLAGRLDKSRNPQ